MSCHPTLLQVLYFMTSSAVIPRCSENFFSRKYKKFLTRIFSTYFFISSAFYQNQMIFHTQKCLFQTKKWKRGNTYTWNKHCKILKVCLSIFTMLCINRLYNLSYVSTLSRVFYANIYVYQNFIKFIIKHLW